jgi:diguanylate cyclase (GGDEF)-like protein
MRPAVNEPIHALVEKSELKSVRSTVRLVWEFFATAFERAKAFYRFLGPERRKIAKAAVLLGLPMVVGMLLCHSILKTMLREDAQSTSNAWVSMLVARNPEILTLLSGAAPSVETTHFLEESSHIGDIYRFRIWNAAGHVVFSSERMATAGEPMQWNRVGEVLVSGSILNEVHSGRAPQNVPFFVQSFIPVKQNGTVVGVFEVYLDQSVDEVLYGRSLFFTEIIMVALALLAGGIPAYKVCRQMIKLRDAKAETVFLSEHDSLTGIPNRHRLEDLGKGALELNRYHKRQLAVLMIDIDRFRDVNDSFGHAAGDKVLKAVAKRIRSSIPDEDFLARFGGDEFVVLQVGMYQPNGSSYLAHQLIEVLAEPYDIGGSQVSCGVSIGIAISPPDADDFDALIACAEVALYKAKADGCDSVRFFEAGMDAKARARCEIETDIRRALATDAFELAYQPIHSFQDGRLLGFEALLRWPEGWSPKSPADFIPIAEESGLMNRIGVWALERACTTAAHWKSPLKVSVNLSPVQFRDGNIASVVKRALRISGLAPELLELEVTESLWIQDTDSVLEQLGRLRKMGVTIALDDFGTGYSSLAYLWKFPFDTLKIDQSFVREMENDPKAAAIVHTIARLGKILDLTITAEGVETIAQARILRDAGCDLAQGYLFGRPLPAASADALANVEPEDADTRTWLAAS